MTFNLTGSLEADVMLLVTVKSVLEVECFEK